jgi:hypothetical protein
MDFKARPGLALVHLCGCSMPYERNEQARASHTHPLGTHAPYLERALLLVGASTENKANAGRLLWKGI